MTAAHALAALPVEMRDAIRKDASHFPPHVQRLGRTCFVEGRVGAIEVGDARVRASVRGTHHFRTEWLWHGATADPRCTCTAAPVCEHAFALACAIDAARAEVPAASREAEEARDVTPPASTTTAHRSGAPAAAAGAGRLAPHEEGARTTLRAVIGLDRGAYGRASIWLEVRATTANHHDTLRSARHLAQLANELHHDSRALAPPHARLLRAVTSVASSAEPLPAATRFELRASAINRLLDSFANSPLVTWAANLPDPDEAPGGIVPGDRLRLGDGTLDVVPVSSGDAHAPSIGLAVRWPDGRLQRLDETVYLPSDHELHPSLVLAGGAFWRVGEEPPAQVVRRLAFGDGGTTPDVAAAGSGFGGAADAIAPHMRVLHTRPVVVLDLGADDWLHVRLFAHTGDTAWRPGSDAPGVIAFELDADGAWLRLDRGESTPSTLAPFGQDDADGADPVPEPEPAPRPADDVVPGDAAPGRETPVQDAWVDVPDPGPIEPVRAWLGTLPLVRRVRRGRGRTASSELDARGGWIRLTARALEAFAESWERRPQGSTFLGSERVRMLLGERRAVRPHVTVTASGVDWFSVSADWQAEGRALTEAEIARLRISPRRFVKLRSGWVSRDWIAAYDAASSLLADLGLEAGAGEQRISLAQLAGARPESLAALEAYGGDRRTIAEIERMRERVRAFEGLPRVAVPERFTGTLRPYQHDGLDFLAFVTDLGLGAVLADDMGLGKTVQALAWIEWMRARDPGGGPVLVVCPASVMHNWQREAERFTPHLRVLMLESGGERHALRREVPHHDLVVTNYALLRRDREHWKSIPLRAAILDEAQNVKNPNAAMSRAVLELDARHRLALTGTPIENRALDLWSIMQFVNPGYLGRRQAFVARYDRTDAPPHSRRLLAARLRPVMIRRLKEDVAPDLPDRIEEHRECALTPGQRKLYLAELMRGRETVERLRRSPEGIDRNKIEVLAALTRLRQICCHPALAGGRADLGSGKFEALFELLEPLLAEGRKVLLFSQFVECIKLLAADMDRRGIRHHMLIGATTKRERVVAAFEQDLEPCVFLISLKAGGTGLNLTAARYVVLFDPWWNPAVEAQAIDRAHRIGQTRTVIAYRMLMAGTIEEKIWELQQKKAALASDVLGEDGFARTLTPGDLDYLLG